MSAKASSVFTLNALAAVFKPQGVALLAKEEEAPLEKRSTSVLKTEAMETVNLALAGMVVGASKDRSLVIPKSKITVFKAYDEVDEGIQEIVNQNWANALVEFACKHGTVAEGRFWIRAAESENGFKIFFAFPLLAESSNKASLSLALADQIAESIKAGVNTSLISFVESQGHEIKSNRRRFCFPKGLHASGFVAANKDSFREDIRLIIKGMEAKPKKDKEGKWVWTDAEKLTYFFDGKAVLAARKAAAEKAGKAAGLGSTGTGDEEDS